MWSGKGGAGLPRANCLLKWKDWLYGLGESGWCNALWQDCRHSILLWKEGEVWQQTTTQHTGNWEDAKYPSDVNDATSSSSKLQAGVLWHCPKTALSSLSCFSHPDTSEHIRKSKCCTYTDWLCDKIFCSTERCSGDREKAWSELIGQILSNFPQPFHEQYLETKDASPVYYNHILLMFCWCSTSTECCFTQACNL